MPRLVDGKVMVPIVPSRIETGRGELLIDGMREMLPDEDGYDRPKEEWLEANV
jgi:hypothetical protein